jgi:hypothetical protein
MMTRPYWVYVIHDIMISSISFLFHYLPNTITFLGKRVLAAQHPRLFPFSLLRLLPKCVFTNQCLSHRRLHRQLPMAIRNTSQRLSSQCLNSNHNNNHMSRNHRSNNSLTQQRLRRLAQLVAMDGIRPM